MRRNGEEAEEQIDHVNAYDKVVRDFNAVTGREGLKSLKFALAAREAAEDRPIGAGLRFIHEERFQSTAPCRFR
ncbi:hypothetical protein [Mesorhizobium japonicum]|uniref:Msl6659 protein n=1 Tax=Mesorhizobium japonicum (strain LMG 29417 / CECT 9101 / MAFF 303099) TaxID=266835 RepID=Q988N8_RHILO|nr:hypothetical protein [Mesorhizobium japonicum]BAB52909.1 msl6659 [Mesorhizobium japonicum MAFF 303099]